jgi:hypothetical protein
VKNDLKRTEELCHAGRNKGFVGLILHAIGVLISPARVQQQAKQAKLKERRQRIKEKKAASIANAKAKKAIKETETEVVLRPPDTDDASRPPKRLKGTSGRATTKTTSRPITEVKKKTKAAQRSEKRPQANNDTIST